VRLVPDAAPPKPVAARALVTLLLALPLAGCSASGSEESAPHGAGPRIGVPLRLADCADWQAADVAERLGTVRQLRDFAGGPTGSPAGRGTTLEDERAYDLLQGYCSAEFAESFKLYKLYTRAAAFQSLSP
jgi:hypothetical protein